MPTITMTGPGGGGKIGDREYAPPPPPPPAAPPTEQLVVLPPAPPPPTHSTSIPRAPGVGVYVVPLVVKTIIFGARDVAFTPGGPGGPVIPGDPVAFRPGGPGGPVLPAAPVFPAFPVAPADPGLPVSPLGPVPPVLPVVPVVPARDCWATNRSTTKNASSNNNKSDPARINSILVSHGRGLLRAVGSGQSIVPRQL